MVSVPPIKFGDYTATKQGNNVVVRKKGFVQIMSVEEFKDFLVKNAPKIKRLKHA